MGYGRRLINPTFPDLLRSAFSYLLYIIQEARKCEVQVAYAIGVASPVGININTFGTGMVSDKKIKKVVEQIFSFIPKQMKKEIINEEVKFKELASYGHVGRSDIVVPWERTNKANLINNLINVING